MRLAMKSDLKKFGQELVVSLPPQVATQLGWVEGDVCEIEIHGNELRIVRVETAKHAQAMRLARRAMEKYRDAFEKLAKF